VVASVSAIHVHRLERVLHPGDSSGYCAEIPGTGLALFALILVTTSRRDARRVGDPAGRRAVGYAAVGLAALTLVIAAGDPRSGAAARERDPLRAR